MTDPVHYVALTETNELGLEERPGWYFWTETWADRVGPYDTIEEARAALKDYAIVVLGHNLND